MDCLFDKALRLLRSAIRKKKLNKTSSVREVEDWAARDDKFSQLEISCEELREISKKIIKNN